MRQLLTSKSVDEPSTVHTTGPADLNPPACSEVVETPTIVPVTPSEAVELASLSVPENSSAATPCQENSEEFSPSPESSTESLPCSRCADLKVKNRRLQKKVSKLKAKNCELKKAKEAIVNVSSFFECQWFVKFWNYRSYRSYFDGC